jgi:hypothetical protein
MKEIISFVPAPVSPIVSMGLLLLTSCSNASDSTVPRNSPKEGLISRLRRPQCYELGVHDRLVANLPALGLVDGGLSRGHFFNGSQPQLSGRLAQ